MWTERKKLHITFTTSEGMQSMQTAYVETQFRHTKKDVLEKTYWLLQ